MRRRERHLTVVFVLALALSPTGFGRAAGPDKKAIDQIAAPAATALDAKQIRARVEAYLESADAPIREADWRALGAGAVPILEEIAQDRERLPTRRARAISALGIVGRGSPSARKLVVAMAQKNAEFSLLRQSAVRSAAQLLDTPALMQAMRPVLEGANNPRVRVAAGEVMIARSPRAGCTQVRRQLARERQEWRSGFEQALTQCTAGLRKSTKD